MQWIIQSLLNQIPAVWVKIAWYRGLQEKYKMLYALPRRGQEVIDSAVYIEHCRHQFSDLVSTFHTPGTSGHETDKILSLSLQ